MKEFTSIVILRWIARITGLISVAFFLSFMLGEGMHDIVRGNGKQLIPFLPFLLIAIIGYFIALFRERLGGIMMVLGGLLLLIYLFYFQDYMIGAMYGLPFIIPGILFYLTGTNQVIHGDGKAI